MVIFYRFLISFLLFLMLIGCSPISSTSTPTSIVLPSSQSIPLIEETKSFSISTEVPSSTSLPGKTPDQTQTAIFQDSVTAQSAEQTLVAQYPHVCKNLYAPREFSPNGLWMVESCYSENDQTPILTLSNKKSQALWKLIYKNYIQQGETLPDGGLAIVNWSNDGSYAYFNSYVSGSGGECFVSGNVLNYGKGLFRLNLQTGDITTILPLRENFVGYDFSFSPTDRRLVYNSYSLGSNILDIKSGKLVKIIPVSEISGGGSYLWSSDGLEFVYSTVSSSEISELITYSIRLVDAQSGREHILLESTKNCYASRVWREDSILIIESYDENYDRTLLEYDLSSNRIISEATATPRP